MKERIEVNAAGQIINIDVWHGVIRMGLLRDSEAFRRTRMSIGK